MLEKCVAIFDDYYTLFDRNAWVEIVDVIYDDTVTFKYKLMD